MPKTKKGRFTKEEDDFILDKHGNYSDDWIANQLERDVNTVTRRRLDIQVKVEQTNVLREDEEIRKQLRSRPYWRDIKEQFSEHELELYEFHWTSLVKQFSDMTHTEELQVLKLVNLELMMNRILTEKNQIIREIDRLQDEITKELGQPPEFQDQARLNQMEVEKAQLIASQVSRTSEYNNLLEKHGKIMKDTKGTRDQRYTAVEAAKTSFFTWLKLHNEEKMRKKDAHEMELMKLAMEKEQDRLAEYHTFGDNTLDRPLLNCSTVVLDSGNQH